MRRVISAQLTGLLLLIPLAGCGTQPKGASTSLDKAASAFLSSGNAWYQQKEYDKAIQDFDQAIRLKPDYSAAIRDLGRALEKVGAFDEAGQVYREGIPIAERNGDLQTLKEMQVFLRRLPQER